MIKVINGLLCLLALSIAVDTRAADNLVMTKYMKSSDVPASFLALAGGSSMTNKIYKDDSAKDRTDKVYYTTTHSYKSTYPLAEIMKTLNPANGRLDTLFKDTTVIKTKYDGIFNVMMEITTPLKDFDCESLLSFKNTKSGNKNVFTYVFSNFNMVFTDMVIQVELEEMGSSVKVNLSQIAAVKASTYTKLSNFFAVGKFESAMKSNIKAFKSGIGGI